MTSPLFPWIGGKSRLAPTILPLFPDHQCYVELFAGGAALFFAKEPSDVEVLNDINGDLTNLYRVVQRHLAEFVRQFQWALTSRQVFEWEKAKAPATLTDIERAARFYYLQRMAFGGRVDGQSFGYATTTPPRLPLTRLEEELSNAWRRLNLGPAYIENLPWHDVLKRYDRPHTLFYADPPYWQTEGYGVPFGFEQYELLADSMARMEGTLILSINDHPDIRRVFAGYPMQSIDIAYTVGGGRGTQAKELIIGNWRSGWPAPRPLSQQFALYG